MLKQTEVEAMRYQHAYCSFELGEIKSGVNWEHAGLVMSVCLSSNEYITPASPCIFSLFLLNGLVFNILQLKKQNIL